MMMSRFEFIQSLGTKSDFLHFFSVGYQFFMPISIVQKSGHSISFLRQLY
jgi:hypothetical protein